MIKLSSTSEEAWIAIISIKEEHKGTKLYHNDLMEKLYLWAGITL